MSMGIVSDEEFDLEQETLTKPREQSNSSPIIKPEIIDMNRGRGIGNIEVPNGLRRIIGETAITDGRRESLQLASSFGISEVSASAYAKGATSTSSYDNTPNKPIISNAKERVVKSARQRLMQAMRALTPDKLNDTKAVDLSTIARNMAGVIKQMEPEKTTNDNGGPTFILYAPQFRSESSFEIVHAKE